MSSDSSPGDTTPPRFRVQIADPRLAADVTKRLAGIRLNTNPAPRTVKVTSLESLRFRADRLPGAIAIVPVLRKNRQILIDLTEAAIQHGVVAVQLVWNRRSPRPDRTEAAVFAVLERYRGRSRIPVILADVSAACPLLLAMLPPQTSR